MKLGVKEFRERFSEIAEASESTVVTKNGRIIGRYEPIGAARFDKARWDETAARLAQFRDDWKARTPDWRERLRDSGFDEDGEPIEQ